MRDAGSDFGGSKFRRARDDFGRIEFRRMKLGTYAARLSCMPPGKQPTFRCALCGPASFANGQRRIECECAAGKSGLRVADNDVYVRCAGHCRQKLSIECLEAIATAAEKLKKELPAGRSIYDPNGIWAAILARVWRDDVDGAPHAAVFVKKTAHGLPAYFTKFCLLTGILLNVVAGYRLRACSAQGKNSDMFISNFAKMANIWG